MFIFVPADNKNQFQTPGPCESTCQPGEGRRCLSEFGDIANSDNGNMCDAVCTEAKAQVHLRMSIRVCMRKCTLTFVFRFGKCVAFKI